MGTDSASNKWYRSLRIAAVVLVGLLMILGQDPLRAADDLPESPFRFRDVAAEAGLLPALSGIRGHGAAWGDVDGDGWIDLYVATFHTGGSSPNLLLKNHQGEFQIADQDALRVSARATGVIFADLDNDGDLDLYIGSMPAPAGTDLAGREGHALAGCKLFRNEGHGQFTDISEGNGACPPQFGGRSATVLDYDGDGLLDLLVGEDPLPGYNGSTTRSSRLFRNCGQLQFEDVSREARLPENVPGLGVAAADVNNDGWPDLFLASSGGGNRLFLNSTEGAFDEAAQSPDVFAWPSSGGDNMICGVHFGDVNRDGLLDLVLGQHYERPWIEGVANRLYLNRRIQNGQPQFEDVTQAVGLEPLPMKAPHVEIQDFDNDGWPDLYTSVVKWSDDAPHPLVYRNQGSSGFLPRFREQVLEVNDFPTAEDRAITRAGTLFDKMLREHKVIYTAAGPTADFDNDGRLDMFLASWWPEAASMLLHNETPGGNWLQVHVEGPAGVNRMGVGSRVNLYREGQAGRPEGRIGCREIAVGYGYASGQPAIVHFGLGELTRVDVEVLLPHGKGRIVRQGVAGNQRVHVRKGEAPAEP